MLKKFKLKQVLGVMALLSITSVTVAAPSISLSQTVGADVTIGACGIDVALDVNLGDSVNYCYVATNDGDVAFDLQSLSSDVFGTLLSEAPNTLAPGGTLQFNDIRTLASSQINTGTWTSKESLFSVTTGGFVDISGTGNLETELGDDGQVNLTIPFAFDYFGTVSSDLRVGNNGAALFGVTTGEVEFSNAALTATEAGMIAPFWDDIGASATTGDLYTETIGTTPNRIFVVQWHQEIHYALPAPPDTENVTFQIALYEMNNEIQFRYQDVLFGGSLAAFDQGASATVGLVSPDGLTILEYSVNGNNLLSDGDVISVFPSAVAAEEASSISSITTVTILVPQVQATPSPLNASVASSGTGSETLSITNTGAGILDWSLGESSAVAKMTSKRPVSFYSPIRQGDVSQFADNNFKSNKGSYVPKIQNNLLGGGSTPVAYAFDVRNGSFGTVDYTSPGAFNEVVATTDSYFAGDFINDDFSTLYVIRGDDGLYSINTADGVATFIAAITGGATGVSGMSVDNNDGVVYISTTSGTSSFLYTIDLATAVTSLIGQVTNSDVLIDIAVSEAGDIYGFDIDSDSLISIDKFTGAGTVIGNIGIDASFAQGMDFDGQSNILYLAAYIGGGVNEIRTIDLLTGASTLVGSVNSGIGGAELDAFAIAQPYDNCYTQEDVLWLSYSVTSGATNAGDTDDVSVAFDASALVDGLYQANICLFSNDPDESLVKIPVSLQVGPMPSDLIFLNGFE